MLEMLRNAVIPTWAGADDEVAKPRQCQRTGRTGIVPRRHTGPRGYGVGVDPPVRHLVEDVRVQIDEARGNDLPARIDHQEGRLGRDAAADGGDPATRDRNVERSFVSSTRIDDLASPDQQVESHGLRFARRP